MSDAHRIQVTDPEKACAIAEGLRIGRAFAFLDTQAVDSGLMGDLKGPYSGSAGGKFVFPLLDAAARELPGVQIQPERVPALTLKAVTSDKAVYHQGREAVHLLACDLGEPETGKVLLLLSSGTEFARRTVELDGQGMGTVTLGNLPVGDYVARWAEASSTEPACEFTVAEYRLAPLAASVARHTLRGTPPRLALMLHLETFGLPVEGQVRLTLMERGRRAERVVERARSGNVYTSFELTGEGPYSVAVQLVEHPSRTASLPIVGSRAEERAETLFSTLGSVVTGSLLPRVGAVEVRGIHLHEVGVESSPFRLERVGDRVARLHAVARAEAVAVASVDPRQPDGTKPDRPFDLVCLPSVASGETIEVRAPAPLALVYVGAFVEGRAWEGTAALLPPPGFAPQIKVREEAMPGDEVRVRVDAAGADGGSAYLIVKDARLPSFDTPGARLAAQIKSTVEEALIAAGDVPPGPHRLRLRGMRHQHGMPPWRARRRGSRRHDMTEVLLREGLISQEQLAEAVELANTKSMTVGEALIRLGYATGGEVLWAMAWVSGLDYVDLTEYLISPGIIEMVPESVARENVILPIAFEDEALVVAMSDPDDIETFDKLRFILNRPILPVLAPRDSIMDAINRHYGQTVGESADSMLQEFCDTAIDFSEFARDRSARKSQRRAALPSEEAEVLFAGLLPVTAGRAETTVRLPTRPAEYAAEVFVVCGRDWASSETRFRAAKSPFAEFQLPAFVHPGDSAVGRLHVGCDSGRLRVRVTRDGHSVPLQFEDKPAPEDEPLEATRAELTFVSRAGDYEATIKDLESGATDRTTARVEVPGRIRHIARTLRVLDAGETVSREGDPSIAWLRVLPNLDRPFRCLIQATTDYQHCCCEQTAAKLLAAAAMYALSGDDLGRRNQAEEAILAGVRRQESMWLPGQGFKAYPHWASLPEPYYGPLAARHLHYLALLGDASDGGLSPALSQAVGKAVEMADDVSRACGLDWPSTRPETCHDVYETVRFHPDAEVRQAALDFLRRRCRERPFLSRPDEVHPRGPVGMRAETAYAAAALLHCAKGADIAEGIELGNRVLADLGCEGRLYSTVDSVAALALMSEIRAARLLDSRVPVAVDGRELTLREAVRCEDVRSVGVREGRAAVEIGRWVEDDWDKYQGGVPIRVALGKRGRPSRQFAVGDQIELVVTLRDRYRFGDLVWVCLPDALSRLVGGGQLKLFSLDLEGRREAQVALVATSPTVDASGNPAPQRFAVCLRNMFDEQRAGNPGYVEVSITAPSAAGR